MDDSLLDPDEDNSFPDDFFQDLTEVCTRHTRHFSFDWEHGSGDEIKIIICFGGEEYE